MISVFFFQAEDGIRYLVRSRGLGDVYKRQGILYSMQIVCIVELSQQIEPLLRATLASQHKPICCLLYTSDAADERSSVDLGGRRIIKQKNILKTQDRPYKYKTQRT